MTFDYPTPINKFLIFQMNCINHRNESAVCQCVICHKGLCENCYKEVESLCVCSSGSCDNSAIAYKMAINLQRKLSYSLSFYFIAGMCFLSWGLIAIINSKFDIYDAGVLALGIVFIIQGLPASKSKNKSPQSENWEK